MTENKKPCVAPDLANSSFLSARSYNIVIYLAFITDIVYPSQDCDIKENKKSKCQMQSILWDPKIRQTSQKTNMAQSARI